jgi:HAD superfamily hydrolase (TIGR01450 family)
MRLAFVTNNASRTPVQVAELLTRLDVPAEPAEVVTSSQAAAHYLADRFAAGSPILVLGTTGLIEAVSERGLRPVFSADDDPVAVVQGYSPTLGWKDLAEGMVAIGKGALWLATNLDPTVPSPRGPLPGNGALVAALAHATGIQPTATGKPDPTMHSESVQRSHADHPLVVGDRLDTDIEGASRASCASLLVLTGVTSVTDLLTAAPEHRPDYLGRDLNALLQAQPEVTVSGTAATCRAWTAGWDGDRIRVERVGDESSAGDSEADSDGLDAARALITACWALADAGVTVRGVTGDAEAAEELRGAGVAVES